MYEYHDDLFDAEEGSNAYRFCCPILIGNHSVGAFLEPPESILVQPDEELPKLRSGTLTFVRHQGEIFGITCAHVVDALEMAIDDDRRKYHALAGAQAPYPSEAWRRFFFPAGDTHVDVNVQLHRANDPDVDLAAGWVPPEVFNAIGREAIDIGESQDLPDEWPAQVGALASGYPEANRRIYGREKPDDTLAISNITLRSVIEKPIGKKVRMFDPLPLGQTTDVDVLSGMSGGPILATVGNQWGIVGIVSGGPDVHSYAKSDSHGFFDTPAINIEGEALDLPSLRSWLGTLNGVRTGRATHDVKVRQAGKITIIT
jgi:hypothetical protein